MLAIWASDAVPAASAGAVTWRWTGYAESDGVRSLLAYVECHAERLRHTYVAWVHDVAACVVDGRTVAEHLRLASGPSYWWLTTLAEQSPWKSPAIVDALRLLAVGEIVASERPTAVRLVGGDVRIDAALRPWCVSRGLAYEWVRPAERTHWGTQPWFRRLPHVVQAIASLGRHCRRRWALRSADHRSWHRDDSAVFFVSYFIHLDADACAHGHFRSGHWGVLPDLLASVGIPTNWLQHYLKSTVVPTPGVALNSVRRFNERARVEGFHSFVDAFLSWRLLARVVRRYAELVVRARALGDVERHLRAYDAPRLWPLMEDDWNRSTRGAVAVGNVLWVELFEAVLSAVPRQARGFFLLENQGWERAFVHAWRAHGHGTLTGVAHSTVRFWDLRYSVDPRSFSDESGARCPQPDRVAVNGPVSRAALRSSGYPEQMLCDSEALRYAGLSAARAFRRPSPDSSLAVLVVTDYNSADTDAVLRMAEEAVYLVDPPMRVVVKPHPNTPVTASRYPRMAFTLATGSLAPELAGCDVVIACNGTSAAVDAYIYGLPVIIALHETGLNYSPLRGEPDVRFVSTALELRAALVDICVPSGEAASHRPMFYDDPALPKWRHLLSLAGVDTHR